MGYGRALILFLIFSSFHASFAEQVWPTPELPKAPASVDGIRETEILLNDRSGKSWQFLFEIPDYRNSGLPYPGAALQDFDFSKWDNLPWKSIKVPGEAVFEGFDILSNNEYYYRRKITIPEAWEGKRILLRFDGVYSNARVWLNGKFLRSHVGGFTTWDCDLTGRIKAGESAMLVVGVADFHSRQRGIWNPEGKLFLKNPANASSYAHHNIGGILRDVSLVLLPKSYLLHTYAETDFDPGFVDATLKVTSAAKLAVNTGATLRIELFDRGKKIAGASAPISSSTPLTLALRVSKPRQWTAETPYLYLLKSSLIVGGKEVETTEQGIGFRELHFGGRDGTERNKLYVNGRPVHLRGTCRHDVSWKRGRSMSREESFNEARAYKASNINFIRTSHYPCSEHLLDACDELGIYVEMEAAVCFQDRSLPGKNSYSDYLDPFTEMVERDRNRASIIIWSLGNESDYRAMERMIGKSPFLGERRYLQTHEPSRPVIFSWPNTGIPRDLVDIHSRHYKLVRNTPWSRYLPLLHEEYAHIPCYNTNELQTDTNTRNFWGESVLRYWNSVISAPEGLGGALWGGIDDVFYIPSGTSERWQRHSSGPAAGYGEWGCIWDAYHRFKPEAWLTQKAYTPVRLDEKRARLDHGRFEIPVENRFDHLSLARLTLTVKVDGKLFSRAPFPADIPPRTAGTLGLEGIPSNTRKLELAFTTPDGITVESAQFEFEDPTPRPRTFGPPPSTFEDAETLTVKGRGYTVVFDKSRAQIREAFSGNKKVIGAGPFINLEGLAQWGWLPSEKGAFSWRKGKDSVTVTLLSTAKRAPQVKFTLELFGSDTLTTRYELMTDPPKGQPRAIGVGYRVPSALSAVTWKRKGLHSTYPDDHIGRNEGKALKIRPGSEQTPDRYGVRPSWPWKDDMRNFFLFSEKDKNDGLVTNDFKAMREAIYTYGLHFGDLHPALMILSDGKSQAARIDVSSHRRVTDDRSARIRYRGEWRNYQSPKDYAGTERYSIGKGASCEFDFTGTGIRFIGSKQRNTGLANIWIDGKLIEQVDTFSDLGNDLKQTVIFSSDTLPEGNHTIRIETAGGKADCIVVDGFEIIGRKGAERERNILLINDQWHYPQINWGNYTGIPPACRKGLSAKSVMTFR